MGDGLISGGNPTEIQRAGSVFQVMGDCKTRMFQIRSGLKQTLALTISVLTLKSGLRLPSQPDHQIYRRIKGNDEVGTGGQDERSCNLSSVDPQQRVVQESIRKPQKNSRRNN